MMDFIMKMGCGIHFHLARETVARFDDIFDLCSLVRLRFICQIWHIFTSIWAMYLISRGYKLIFHSPQSDWLPIPWIYSDSPSSLSLSSIFAQLFTNFFHFKLLQHLHKVVIHLSMLLSHRGLEPNWVGSRRVSVHSPQYDCTVPACPRLDPITGSPGRRDSFAPSTEFWSVDWVWGGKEQSETHLGRCLVWISLESMTRCRVLPGPGCCRCQTLNTVHYPPAGTGVSRLGYSFLLSRIVRRKSQNMCIYYTRY